MGIIPMATFSVASLLMLFLGLHWAWGFIVGRFQDTLIYCNGIPVRDVNVWTRVAGIEPTSVMNLSLVGTQSHSESF